MAAITSTQAGDWSLTATWTGGTIPGDGDTVTISHAVTITDTRTIGTSPVAGTVVCLVVSAGSLTIATGGLLILRGDLEARGQIVFAGGSELRFDSTAAAAPTSTSYRTRVSNASSAGNGQFITSGTSASSRAVVASLKTGGAANGYMDADSSRGYYILDYVDFSDVGLAGTPVIAAAVTSTASTIQITNCTFARCGVISLASLATNAVGRFEYLTFRNGLADGSLDFGATSAIGTGTRTLRYVTTDQQVMRTGSAVGLRDFAIDHVICTKGFAFSSSANTSPASVAQCYFRLAADFGQNNVTWTAPSVSDCYVFFQNAGTSTNPHPCFFGTQNDVVVTRAVIECGDTVTDSTGDLFIAPAPGTARNYTIRNCLSLPLGGDMAKHAGQFCSALGGANCSMYLFHNTYVTSGLAVENGAPGYGETYAGYGGIFKAVKGNLAYGLVPNAGQVFIRRVTSTVSDGVAAVDCDYNGVHQPVSAAQALGSYPGVPGHYDWTVAPPSQPMFSSTSGLGAHNVIGDPAMVDPTRNIATWAVSRGSVSGTYAARAADAEAYLLADPTLIDDLLAHVRGGWAPTNPAYRDAGHDGATIGAVEGVWSGGGGGGSSAIPSGFHTALSLSL